MHGQVGGVEAQADCCWRPSCGGWSGWSGCRAAPGSTSSSGVGFTGRHPARSAIGSRSRPPTSRSGCNCHLTKRVIRRSACVPSGCRVRRRANCPAGRTALRWVPAPQHPVCCTCMAPFAICFRTAARSLRFTRRGSLCWRWTTGVGAKARQRCRPRPASSKTPNSPTPNGSAGCPIRRRGFYLDIRWALAWRLNWRCATAHRRAMPRWCWSRP